MVFQPLGVVGIVVPWNYPLYLAIGPLVASVVLVAAPIAVLIATRPTRRPPTWSADQVVRTVCWGLACVCTACSGRQKAMASAVRG